MTGEQLEMISTDPRVMHGQAVITGSRVPVSVILDCLAAGMTSEEITAEYPTVTAAGVRAAAAYGAALARGTATAAAAAVRFKLDENLPASSAVTKAISDLTGFAEPASLTGAVAVLQRGLLRIRRP